MQHNWVRYCIFEMKMLNFPLFKDCIKPKLDEEMAKPWITKNLRHTSNAEVTQKGKRLQRRYWHFCLKRKQIIQSFHCLSHFPRFSR